MQIQAQAMSMRASADFLGNGAIEVNKYEAEILDILRRTSPTVQRMKDMRRWRPATGHPHRYFEQLAVASAAATDPRAIAPTATGPNRVERAAMVKAVVAQSNFSHFDVEVTQSQGQFAQIEAQDIADIASAVVLKEASMFWQGTDTSLTAPTTLEWVGALQQLATGGNVVSVLKGASIIDGLKTEVATLMTSTTFGVKPSAIYLNPLLADAIDKEAKATAYKFNVVEFVAGEQVNAVQTQAGILPLVPDPFLPNYTSGTYPTFLSSLVSWPSGATNCYVGVILQENLVEMAYVNPNGSEDPRIFQLGLLSGLSGQFVSIAYNNLIVKGSNYAHALVLCFS